MGRRAFAAAAAVCGLLVLAAPAGADTEFGADPAAGINTAFTCSRGAPTGYKFAPEVFFGTEGAQSCMWTWNNPAVGSDIVPIPATGGSGTITSVTLPAMPAPGPMAVVVLTAALNSTGDPGHPQSICCQVKQVGPTFTVPAGQVTTVPQSLHVSATEVADLSVNGDTSFGDLVGIAVFSPNASLPIHYTGATGLFNFDGAYVYYPAPAGANGEYTTPFDPAGFQLLARFTFAAETPAPPPGPPAPPAPPPPTSGPAAKEGVMIRGNVLRPGADGRTVQIGKATDPPTARTIQTLALPTAKASVAAPKKPTLLGSGKTTVPSGKTVPLKLTLNSRGRAKLRARGSLKATLTVLAINARGETQAVVRSVTLKAPRKKGKSGR